MCCSCFVIHIGHVDEDSVDNDMTFNLTMQNIPHKANLRTTYQAIYNCLISQEMFEALN